MSKPVEIIACSGVCDICAIGKCKYQYHGMHYCQLCYDEEMAKENDNEN